MGISLTNTPQNPITTLDSYLMTGAYYGFRNNKGISNVAVSANTLYGIPILIPRNITVDRIAVEVQSTGAGGTVARLGLYNNGTNMYPGTLLLDAGTVAVDATGVKTITIAQALPQGLYWAAVVSNGTPTLRAWASADAGGLGIRATDFTAIECAWSVAFTYAALPTPFTASGTANATTAYVVALRVLSLD